MIGTVQDITEKTVPRDRLRELGAIVESSDDAILAQVPGWVYYQVNKGAETLYGYTENEVIGQSISILVPADHPDEVPEILFGRLARGEAVKDYETVRRRKDGKEFSYP